MGLSKLNGVTWGNLSKVNGVAKASISKINGIVTAAPAFSVEVTTATTPQDFKLSLAGASSLRITWGDTSENTYTGSDGVKTHSYATPGTYTITFVSGTATKISFGEGGCTPTLLTKVKTAVPAALGLTSGYFMFNSCANITSWAANFFDAASAALTNAQEMFEYMPAFNEDISGWNTGNLTTMFGMFYDCRAFNQNIGNWNTSKVTNMEWVFGMDAASQFNQSLAGWDVSNVTTMNGMFWGNTSFAKASYDPTLVAWAALAVENNVYLDAGPAHYSAGDPTTAHDHLTGTHSWTISDGGTP